MYWNLDYTAGGKALLESQIAAFDALTRIASQSAERAFELNMAAARVCAADSIAAATECLAVRDPQALWALTSALAKSNVERMAAYNGNVAELRLATRAELAKMANEQVSSAHDKVSAAVEAFARNAPAGAEPLVTLMKASVMTAPTGRRDIAGAGKAATRGAAIQ